MDERTQREKREAPDIFRTRTPIPPDTRPLTHLSPSPSHERLSHQKSPCHPRWHAPPT
jgi:hypothetical protein